MGRHIATVAVGCNATPCIRKENISMYYDYFETGLIGTLTLVGDDTGLRHIEFEKKKKPVTIQEDWKKNPDFFVPHKAQLRAYFNGALKVFDLPLALVGTPFQLKVWRALRTVA